MKKNIHIRTACKKLQPTKTADYPNARKRGTHADTHALAFHLMPEESPSGGRSRIYKRADDCRPDAGTATWALAGFRPVFG